MQIIFKVIYRRIVKTQTLSSFRVTSSVVSRYKIREGILHRRSI